MSNKKHIIPTLLILVFFCSGSSRSEILDGGEIQFSGFVTNEAPKWTWQLGSLGQTWVTDIADGRVEKGMVVFDLKDKGALPFLEGHLHEVAERTGSGLTPFITFSSDGQPLNVTTAGNTTLQQFRASIPVQDAHSGIAVGQLAFTLMQGMGIVPGKHGEAINVLPGMSLVQGESVSDVHPAGLSPALRTRLSSLLLMNRGFGNGMNAAINGQVINQSVLADGRIMDLAAAYASAVSDFELRLPAQNTPVKWRARLNVTVTVQ